MDLKQGEAIIEWTPPKNVTRIKRFLGAIGFLCHFIKRYAHIAIPLTGLIKWDSFTWGDLAKKAFQALKNAMITTLIFTTLDFNNPFTLECDASGVGVEAILLQDNRPIAYKSHKLNSREKLKPIYDKEMLAIMHAINHWRQYLFVNKFIVETEHYSLKYFLV